MFQPVGLDCRGVLDAGIDGWGRLRVPDMPSVHFHRRLLVIR